jgi:hypothetical protein
VSGTFSLQASASAPSGIAYLSFYVDGLPGVRDPDDAAPWQLAFDTTTLTNGSHTFWAQAVDGDGKVIVSPKVTATVDNAAATTGDAGALVFDDRFDERRLDSSGRPIFVPPWAYVQPYSWPSIDGYVNGLRAGSSAMRFHLRDGISTSWPGSEASEVTTVTRWVDSSGKWIGYRLGQTDYYAFRFNVRSVPNYIHSFIQLGYSKIRYGALGLRIENGLFKLIASTGYSNQNVCPGCLNEYTNWGDPPLGSVTLNRWEDLIVRVKWATGWTGEVDVWHRSPELSSAWVQVLSWRGIPTQTWGYDLDGIYVDQNGIQRDGTPRGVTDKMSLYRPAVSGQADATVDYDRFVVASSFDGAAGAIP